MELVRNNIRKSHGGMGTRYIPQPMLFRLTMPFELFLIKDAEITHVAIVCKRGFAFVFCRMMRELMR